MRTSTRCRARSRSHPSVFDKGGRVQSCREADPRRIGVRRSPSCWSIHTVPWSSARASAAVWTICCNGLAMHSRGRSTVPARRSCGTSTRLNSAQRDSTSHHSCENGASTIDAMDRQGPSQHNTAGRSIADRCAALSYSTRRVATRMARCSTTRKSQECRRAVQG